MRYRLLAILFAMFATFSSCKLMLGENPRYEPDPHWTAPSDATAKLNPLAGKSQLSAGGKKIFLRECAECHGQDATGLDKKHSANLLAPFVQSQSDGAIFWKISNGNPDRGMPSFSKLPELQRWQIVLYLRTLKP
jgi:mono/diheme cytochrome c family protein